MGVIVLNQGEGYVLKLNQYRQMVNGNSLASAPLLSLLTVFLHFREHQMLEERMMGCKAGNAKPGKPVPKASPENVAAQEGQGSRSG